MMREIVFATNNAHKLAEMQAIVGDSFGLRSLADIGCHEDIPETADTLEGNALMKARYVKEHYGYDCFADDTGLEVKALEGAPGVHSARYAPGVGHDAEANTRLLLHNLENVDDRSARFRTVIALILDGKEYTVDGIVNGVITREKAGVGGFGYDPVFRPDGFDITFAEMDADSKNSISHRGNATRNLLQLLSSL